MERDHTGNRRERIKYVPDHDGVRFKATVLPGIVFPSHHQLVHITAIDLRQTGVVILRRLPTGYRPVLCIVPADLGTVIFYRKRTRAKPHPAPAQQATAIPSCYPLNSMLQELKPSHRVLLEVS